MHVLVTGGSGFIGQGLCPALLEAGHRVSVLSRDPARAQQPLPPRVACVGSLEALRGVDAVINLQGESLAGGRWTAARKQAFRDSRVGFTHTLVAWMRQSPAPRVLISGSAIGWYGDRADETLTEDAVPGTGFAADLCRDWEAAAMQATFARVACVRIGVVLDPAGGALRQMLPAFRAGLGGRLGRGRQWMSWISRNDLVRLLIALLESPDAHGVHNGTAPQPLRQSDFARALARRLHRPAWMPMPALALRALLGEMAGLLLESQRVLPRAARDRGFVFEQPDIEAALDVWFGPLRPPGDGNAARSAGSGRAPPRRGRR